MAFFNSCNAANDDKVHEPVVAGSFYPGDPDALAAMVDEMLSSADVPSVEYPVSGLIAPHAGYVYSGHVAAHAYAMLRDSQTKRVVVISPSHLESFEGASIYDGDAYETPLGRIEVDEEFADRLANSHPKLYRSSKGHESRRMGRGEHALEVQLPFLQRVLDSFTLVPIIMGNQEYATCRALGKSLAELIGNDRTVIVASSDLSHFHPYNTAVKKDRSVINAVHEWDYYNLSRNLQSHHWEACGGGPIVATMIAAERLGASDARLLEYANSGDIPHGDRSRVVGYSAFAFLKNPKIKHDESDFSLSQDEKATLLSIARNAVETMIKEGEIYDCSDVDQENLLQDRGAFVTLKINGQLRGCIGYTAPLKPLCETVRDVAIQAAIKDYRFTPVSEEELDKLSYDISVLSPFHHVSDIDAICTGTHGLLIQKGNQVGLLLPQVATDQGWDRETFLAHTCIKAGLPADAWQDDQTDIFCFRALVFGEKQ
jgi:hypothetical protein